MDDLNPVPKLPISMKNGWKLFIGIGVTLVVAFFFYLHIPVRQSLSFWLPKGAFIREIVKIPRTWPNKYLAIWIEPGYTRTPDEDSASYSYFEFGGCQEEFLGQYISGHYHLGVFSLGLLLQDLKIPYQQDNKDIPLPLTWNKMVNNDIHLIQQQLIQLEDLTGDGEPSEFALYTTQGRCGFWESMVFGFDTRSQKLVQYSDWIERFRPNSQGEVDTLFECGDHGNQMRQKRHYKFNALEKKLNLVSETLTDCAVESAKRQVENMSMVEYLVKQTNKENINIKITTEGDWENGPIVKLVTSLNEPKLTFKFSPFGNTLYLLVRETSGEWQNYFSWKLIVDKDLYLGKDQTNWRWLKYNSPEYRLDYPEIWNVINNTQEVSWDDGGLEAGLFPKFKIIQTNKSDKSEYSSLADFAIRKLVTDYKDWGWPSKSLKTGTTANGRQEYWTEFKKDEKTGRIWFTESNGKYFTIVGSYHASNTALATVIYRMYYSIVFEQ